MVFIVIEEWETSFNGWAYEILGVYSNGAEALAEVSRLKEENKGSDTRYSFEEWAVH